MVNIAIVCEGKDDEDFLKKLIKHLGFNEASVSFYLFHGKSDLFKSNHKRYNDLKLLIDAGQIEKVLFVADADNIANDAVYGGFENTKENINTTIEQLGIIDVSHTYIMCDPVTKIGYLESFILSTIAAEQRNGIQCFLNCSQFKSKENHKAIIKQIYNLAYPNAPYDFEHNNFDKLKSELTNMFTVNNLPNE